MAWLREEVKGAIEDVVEDMTEMLLGLMNSTYDAISASIFAFPAPTSSP